MGGHIVSKALRRFLSTSKTPAVSRSILPWRCRRCYSIQSQEEELARLPDIDPRALSIERTTTPKTIIPPHELVFGHAFTGKYNCTEAMEDNTDSIALNRPYAINRMDSNLWLACPSNNPLPKSLPRPRNLRFPLRLHVLRRYESLQKLRGPSAPLSP